MITQLRQFDISVCLNAFISRHILKFWTLFVLIILKFVENKAKPHVFIICGRSIQVKIINKSSSRRPKDGRGRLTQLAANYGFYSQRSHFIEADKYFMEHFIKSRLTEKSFFFFFSEIVHADKNHQ